MGEEPVPSLLRYYKTVKQERIVENTQRDKMLKLKIFQEIRGFTSEQIKVEYKKLYQGVYQICEGQSISKIHLDIYDLILKKQGDGSNIMVNMSECISTCNIFLIDNNEFNYLVDYFTTNYFKLIDDEDEKDVDFTMYKNGILSINHYDNSIEEDIQQIIKQLQKYGIETKLINFTETSTECGTGSFLTTAILAIVSAATGVAVNKILEIINEKWKEKKYIENYITYGDFNMEKLYLNIARQYKDSRIKKCKVSKFEEYNTDICIELTSCDKSYWVRADKTANVLECRVTYFI